MSTSFIATHLSRKMGIVLTALSCTFWVGNEESVHTLSLKLREKEKKRSAESVIETNGKYRAYSSRGWGEMNWKSIQ